MKLKPLPFIKLIIAIFIAGISSCSSKPDLNKGLKVTIKLSFKGAITQVAFNPKDSMLTNVLNHIDDNQNSSDQFITAFMDQYEKQYPGNNPAEKFYISASNDSSIPISKKELKDHLLKTISGNISKMTEVTASRIQAFSGAKQEDIKIDFKGQMMTVYVPGITDENMLKPIFGNRDGIRFWATADFAELAPYLLRVNDTLSLELKSLHKKTEQKIDSSSEISLTELVEQNKVEDEYASPLLSVLMPAIDPTGKPTGASYMGIANQKDTAKVNNYLQKQKVKFILPQNVQFMWGELPGQKYGDKKPLALYAIITPPTGLPLVNSQDVKDAKADEQNGRVEISMTMTPPGAIKWARVTAERVGKPIAMEIGNYIYSAPNVNEPIHGGKSSITGDFNLKEAAELAKIINTGGYPLQFEIVKTEPFENKN